MRRFLRVALIVLAIAVVGVAGFAAYFVNKYPDAGPAPSLRVEATPARVERGRYLANHVTVCIDCHSTRDWAKFSGPVVPGTEGLGGFKFGEELGLPGVLYAKNITPYAIGSMSDGQLFHTITSGIGKDGSALFPLMPYPNYNQMSDEDIASVIAYIRTLAPLKSEVPKRSLDFPLNVIVRTIPTPHTPTNAPDTSNELAYGKYLVTIASCADCHTPAEKGEPLKGMEFAGGSEISMPEGVVRPANLTPDEETGIGLWSKEIFIAKFKAFDHPDSTVLDVHANGYNTPMPWTMYGGMTERDLGAIWTYLRTLTPVKHKVERFSKGAVALR
jgi:mono/diheme cytochrome c family protein